MPRPKPGERKQRARPQKEIRWDEVDQLLMAHVPGTEIASKFDMHPQTFYDRVLIEKGMIFTDYAARLRDSGKAILRAAQYSKAIKGSERMLIHLGEHLLGQIRKNEVEHSGAVTVIRGEFNATSRIADHSPPDAQTTSLPDTPMELS